MLLPLNNKIHELIAILTLNEKGQVVESIVISPRPQTVNCYTLGDVNIENSERLVIALNSVSNSISNIISNFEKQKDRYTFVTEELNLNIIKLNTHMNNLSSDNLKAIYSNIIQSIETMKADMDKIEWKFTQGLVSYDDKIKNSLEQIDSETAKIISSLTEFKNLSK